MPIYEYRCKECAERFEKLVFSSNKEPVCCPKCRSEKTEKQISTFASTNSGEGHSAGSVSSSGCEYSGFS